ncbi:hypothetical protein [Neptunicella marina]|uniref:Nitroreductase domain-containing protein n=1 Tax=Neptunicella marina TaxID=2125989 RepID=A0A8J6M431_9ALTE|nr:hypothetical protein [Neptunicella marina]MBC3765786.1 hypothetical protein [Neptunicella marina]
MDDIHQKQILDAAIQAPSADNSQPFLYKWDNDNCLSLFLDERLCGHATDKTFVLSDLAIGAVIESVTIQAQSLGYETTVNYFPEGANSVFYVAAVVFSKPSSEQARANAERLAEQISERRTDRRFPFGGHVNDETIARISSAISDKRCQLKVFNEPDQISSIVPVIYRAEKIRFESEVLHQELFKTVVFNYDPTPVGMNLDVLGIAKFEKAGFKIMSNWKIMRLLNFIGASKEIAKKSVVKPINSSPGLLMLSSSDISRDGIINAGRQLMRIWLECTSQGLSVQLYAAPGVLTLAKPDIEPNLMKELGLIEKQLDDISGNIFKTIMFLRVGYMKDTVAKTQRRQASSFLKE